MITRVRVKNFKSLADTDVTLGPLTVLVGRNGAGKSAFVDALRFVRDALQFDLNRAIAERNGLGLLRYRAKDHSPFDEIEFAIFVQGEHYWGEYAFAVGASAEGGYGIKSESCKYGKQGQPAQKDYEFRNGKWITFPQNPFSPNKSVRFEALNLEPQKLVLSYLNGSDPDYTHLHYLLSGTCFYTIDPEKFRTLQSLTQDYPLDEHGKNLASALRRLKQTEWYPDLLAALGYITGDVTGITIEESGSYLLTSLVHRLENGDEVSFLLEQESEGTLRALGLLVAIYQEGKHVLTTIEEPELSLYPHAFGLLKDVFREASLRQQILITTHSPDLIAHFGASELRIVEKTDGTTHIGPLVEHQREAINKQLFNGGDLLRIEGLYTAPVTIADEIHV